MAEKNNRWFNTSTGSGDLSLTIKGMMMAFVPFVITLLQSLGVPLTETYIVELVEAVAAAVASVAILIGLLRKGYNAYKARYK